VSATRVIEAVDVLKDGDLSGPMDLPGMPPDQFGLDGFEVCFHRSIVTAITFAAHALPVSACLHA
jgi:hypothetical protein